MVEFHISQSFSVFPIFLPDRTLLCGVHPSSRLALVGRSELHRVGEGADNSDWTRGMDCGPDPGEGIFRPHGPAPDLRVVQEKYLIMGKAQAWTVVQSLESYDLE